MTLPGMKSTADFVADERPRNWRAGILVSSPRNNMPLFALTSMMKSESTDDYEFNWWEEKVFLYNFALTANITNSATTIPLAGNATKLKQGDMLVLNLTNEPIRVVSITNDNSIEVLRAFTAYTKPDGTPVAAGTGTAVAFATDAKLRLIGSAYAQGASRPKGTSHNPIKRTNLTQIMRTSIELTRTAAQNNYRTGDPWKNDTRRALNQHGIACERAFWEGVKSETLEGGQPLTTTEGVCTAMQNRAPQNIRTVTAGGVDMDEWESYMPDIFAFGNSEKVGWCSLKTMTIINQIVRKNTEYQWGPTEKEYGMNVKRLFSPSGTLTLMEHPLFGQAGQFLAEDLFIMDTEFVKYRYLQDTIMLDERQANDVDGKAKEWLTEAGLELQQADHHFWLRGFKAAAIDD